MGCVVHRTDDGKKTTYKSVKKGHCATLQTVIHRNWNTENTYNVHRTVLNFSTRWRQYSIVVTNVFILKYQLNFSRKAGGKWFDGRLYCLKRRASTGNTVLSTPLTLNGEKTGSTWSNPWQVKEQVQQESQTNSLTVCSHFINKTEQNSEQGSPMVLQIQFILEWVARSTTAIP